MQSPLSVPGGGRSWCSLEIPIFVSRFQNRNLEPRGENPSSWERCCWAAGAQLCSEADETEAKAAGPWAAAHWQTTLRIRVNIWSPCTFTPYCLPPPPFFFLFGSNKPRNLVKPQENLWVLMLNPLIGCYHSLFSWITGDAGYGDDSIWPVLIREKRECRVILSCLPGKMSNAATISG